MGFIQNLFNNKPSSVAFGESTCNFVKENKDEIKNIFSEIKDSANAKKEEKELGIFNWGVAPTIANYTEAALENDNLKELISEGWDNLKSDMKTWAKEENLIGDLANLFSKDKNIEAEG